MPKTDAAAQQMWEEPDTREPESDEEKAARLADEAERRAMEVPIHSTNPRRELNKLRGMVKQGGMDPNEAAMLLGYDNGEALVLDLLPNTFPPYQGLTNAVRVVIGQ